jgi:hypothetical protein
MDLTQYVSDLQHQLAVAAEAGGDEARALAGRLTAPLESAARLALLDALSAAAAEITRDLAPGSVDVRLRGREPTFVVTLPPADEPFGSPAGPAEGGALPAAPPEGDEGGMSRVNFRLPEHLKTRIEDAAAQEGLSVNAWLVRIAAAAVQSPDDVRDQGRRAPRGGQRFTGWVR